MIIRPSSISTFLDCARRWVAQHMAVEVREAGYRLNRLRSHVGAPIGTGVHGGAAVALGEKKGREMLPVGARASALDASVSAFATAIEELSGYSNGMNFDATASDLPMAEKQVVRMTKAYLDSVDQRPTLQPMIIEERAAIDIGDGFVLSGQVDSIVGIEEIGPASEIKDLKTTGARGLPNVAGQIGSYRMIHEGHGRAIERASIDLAKRVPMKKAQPDIRFLPVDLEEAENLARLSLVEIKRTVRAFRQTRSPKLIRANAASVFCSDRFCPAYGTGFCRTPLLDLEDRS
ncbi:MAG: PD-(D/E)XK nuclease family protein [Geminicoccaceae bacterium]